MNPPDVNIHQHHLKRFGGIQFQKAHMHVPDFEMTNKTIPTKINVSINQETVPDIHYHYHVHNENPFKKCYLRH